MSEADVSPARRRGRGAASNAAGRYERFRREGVDDGWGIDPEEGAAERVLRTHVREERVGRAMARNSSPDISFDRSLNPYRGCEHGCIYCFARPTHAYLGLSPGLDFETRLVARPNAPERLEAELRARSYRPRMLAIGTNTDPYQPIERDRRIMRRVLEVLERFNHPVGIVTKGAMVERDADILGRMAEKGLVRVGMTVTTLDTALSRSMEPRVPLPERRWQAMRALVAAGVPCHVMVSPMIPALNDHEMETILEAAAKAGAGAASTITLRLPLEVAPLFEAWLKQHVPDRAERVLRRVRELHGGRLYDPAFGKRFTGQGEWARLMARRFEVARKRLRLKATKDLPELRRDLFEPPLAAGAQLALF